MTVTAPPRPPRPSDPVDRQEVEALVEALIEEARQRARRRRRVRMAVVACVVLVGATVFAVFERTAESQSSSPALTARSGVSGGKVKVVIAGTNDRIPPANGWKPRGQGHLQGQWGDHGCRDSPRLPDRACGWDVDHASLRRQGQEGHDHIRGQDRHERRNIPVDDCLRHEGVQGSSRQRHRDRERELHRQHPEGNRVALRSPSSR